MHSSPPRRDSAYSVPMGEDHSYGGLSINVDPPGDARVTGMSFDNGFSVPVEQVEPVDLEIDLVHHSQDYADNASDGPPKSPGLAPTETNVLSRDEETRDLHAALANGNEERTSVQQDTPSKVLDSHHQAASGESTQPLGLSTNTLDNADQDTDLLMLLELLTLQEQSFGLRSSAPLRGRLPSRRHTGIFTAADVLLHKVCVAGTRGPETRGARVVKTRRVACPRPLRPAPSLALAKIGEL